MYVDVADANILRVESHDNYDLITGRDDTKILPIKYNRSREDWNLDNKYLIAKKESIDSFDWFINEYNKAGWEVSADDKENMKKIWMMAGAPFLSHIDPYNNNQEATNMHYVVTSRIINPSTRIVSENKDWYVGSPDIIVLPHPNKGYDTQGPFGILDELGHAIQFSYTKGFKGKNISGAKDMATFIASDEFIELLKNKKIASDRNGNELLVAQEGYSRVGALEYDEDITDSTLFIMSQQMKGDPYLDTGVVNMFDNPEHYDNNGNFLLRYALASNASGQWLTGEAQAHNLLSPALNLALADLKTSDAGDRALSKSDIDELSKSTFGKGLLSNLVYNYGIGQEDINYGTLSGIDKRKYVASNDPKLVQYNKRITTDDDQYKQSKANEDIYIKQYSKEYKETLKSLTDFRKNYPNERLETFLKQQKRR